MFIALCKAAAWNSTGLSSQLLLLAAFLLRALVFLLLRIVLAPSLLRSLSHTPSQYTMCNILITVIVCYYCETVIMIIFVIGPLILLGRHHNVVPILSALRLLLREQF